MSQTLTQGCVIILSLIYHLIISSYSKTIRIEDFKSSLIGLLSNDPTGWLKNRLDRLVEILQHKSPKSLSPYEAGQLKKLQPKFKTLYYDLYNRFAERVCVLFLYVIY
jgi:hypothetical protein